MNRQAKTTKMLLRRVLFVVGAGVAIALWVLAMVLTFSDRVAP